MGNNFDSPTKRANEEENDDRGRVFETFASAVEREIENYLDPHIYVSQALILCSGGEKIDFDSQILQLQQVNGFVSLELQRPPKEFFHTVELHYQQSERQCEEMH